MFDLSDPIVFEPQPRMRRRFFGLRRRDVLRELEGRDAAIETSRKRAQAAGGDADRLRRELAALQEEMEQARRDITALHEAGSMTGAMGAIGAMGAEDSSKFCDCPPSHTLLEEMTKVVSVTEESTRKILEHARITLMREIDAAEALREQARSEIAQAAAWRQHWGPVIKALQETIRQTQGAIDEIPERIRHALAPLTASAAALDHDLLQFAAFEDSIQRPASGSEDGEANATGSEEDAPAQAAGRDGPVVVGEAEGPAIVIADQEDRSGDTAGPSDGAAIPVS
jgi:chromosome segregation ATPase